jgi:hypothetical protein
MITVFFLILSLLLNFVYFIPFFFLPLCCWLPFAFRGRREMRSEYQPYYEPTSPQKLKEEGIQYCPVCGGEIRETIAKYCYHCGAKLHKN